MFYNIFRHIPRGGRPPSRVILSEHLKQNQGLSVWIWDGVVRGVVPAQRPGTERQGSERINPPRVWVRSQFSTIKTHL